MADQTQQPPLQPVNNHQEPERPRRNTLVELVVIVASALILALLIQTFLVKPFRIPSESMVPTLQVGQRILVDRVEGRFGEPERGDVVVFKPPMGAGSNTCGVAPGQEYAPGQVYRSSEDLIGERMPCPKGTPGKFRENFVKRVIGMPGDRLKIIRGHAYINGHELNEPYVNREDSCDQPDTFSSDCTFSLEITIPPDHYFMMGDNRNASADSRYWGPIPKDNIVGEAFATYWPPSRIGGL